MLLEEADYWPADLLLSASEKYYALVIPMTLAVKKLERPEACKSENDYLLNTRLIPAIHLPSTWLRAIEFG